MAYKPKPCLDCAMPGNVKLNVLVLNASLKHEPELSNTGELSELVLSEMAGFCDIDSEVVRLADLNLPVGLGYKESEDDDWPSVGKKVKAADVVLFATPVWWGNRSSLMQRVIERMDAFDEDYLKSGRSALYNKVAGIVITGSEDGALHTLGTVQTVLTFFGFTQPPENACYWVGEVGQPPSLDRDKRLKNESTKHMAKNLARNAVFYAQLLKKHPLKPKE